jgi:hypothetical protein
MKRLAAVLVSAVFIVGAASVAGAASAPAADPPNQPPTQAFEIACYGRKNPTPRCDTEAIKNINTAHAVEGLGPITLPGDYSTLTIQQQMIAISNSERNIRGIGTLVETAALDRRAAKGARTQSDPIGPNGHAWGSIWAGVADPLAADYLWMYDDGPGGINLDCQNPGDPGCWGHRHNILGASYVRAGAGARHASLAELFVQ